MKNGRRRVETLPPAVVLAEESGSLLGSAD
jgi:hypothetical protein